MKWSEKFKNILYVVTCNLYRKLTLFYYKTKYKNIKRLSTSKYSHIKYQRNSPISEIIDIKRIHKTIKSEYQEVLILEKEYIREVLKNIFDNKFKKFIYKYTNAKFSIDFFLLYQNNYINKKNRYKSIYANNMHIDKPFSPFTLKIFIPINIFSDKYGPLEVKVNNYNNYSSDSYNSRDFIKFYSEKNLTNIFIFNPSENYHRACIPRKNYYSRNLLIQLNPSKDWSICQNLYLKQFNIEPNFPEFRNLNNFRELI